ncbi:MAG: hypothetical protein O3C32_00775 [Bacteroidetes bacterium]|nr:hypothetical protein [Bacteroidota bacterium]
MSNLIVHLPTGKKLEIASCDLFQEQVPLNSMREQHISEGWRLPNIEELMLLKSELHEQGLGDFHSDWYWSRESFYVSWDYSVNMGLDFQSGNTNAKALGAPASETQGLCVAYIRLVRLLPEE